MKIIIVAGARPNFMKIAPLLNTFKEFNKIDYFFVHTGQHYDDKMSKLFFNQLAIPEPDINLKVGSASHAVQTAKIMEKFEKVCISQKPDMVLVVGDVNSTLACTIVSAKLNIKTCHYEAGLRSFDRTMPEEINRLVTDSITDLFLTTSYDANDNLIREGICSKKIHMVGNLMIDCLLRSINSNKGSQSLRTHDNKLIKISNELNQKRFGLMTFHRPSNVDDKNILEQLVKIWSQLSNSVSIVFPIHPRTLKNLNSFKLLNFLVKKPNIIMLEPLGYLEFISLLKKSSFVLTDSGGIQEESSFLNIPCLTLRDNTERPVTILEGTNKLVKIDEIISEIEAILGGAGKVGSKIKYWDGHTSKRISKILINYFYK